MLASSSSPFEYLKCRKQVHSFDFHITQIEMVWLIFARHKHQVNAINELHAGHGGNAEI
jgi:hypothetical protein